MHWPLTGALQNVLFSRWRPALAFRAVVFTATVVPPTLAWQGDVVRSVATTESGPEDGGGGGSSSRFGTRRGNLCYIQTSISPTLSGMLDERSKQEDVVLGEVAYQAVLAMNGDGLGRRVRRRRSGNPVRRDIGFLPDEAEDTVQRAAAAGYRPSAFLRLALEGYLNVGVSVGGRSDGRDGQVHPRPTELFRRSRRRAGRIGLLASVSCSGGGVADMDQTLADVVARQQPDQRLGRPFETVEDVLGGNQ